MSDRERLVFVKTRSRGEDFGNGQDDEPEDDGEELNVEAGIEEQPCRREVRLCVELIDESHRSPYDLASEDGARVRRAIGSVPGVQRYLSGYPAINHDTQDIFNKDLGKGESIAVPIALLVMIFMFGTLGGIAVPIAFAAVTIPTTLGFVWIFAHLMDMAIYVTNIVALVGLGLGLRRTSHPELLGWLAPVAAAAAAATFLVIGETSRRAVPPTPSPGSSPNR